MIVGGFAAAPRGASRGEAAVGFIEAAVPDKHASSSSSTKMNVRPLALVLVLLHLHDSAGTPNLLLVLPGRSGHDTMRHATAPSDDTTEGTEKERASERVCACSSASRSRIHGRCGLVHWQCC